MSESRYVKEKDYKLLYSLSAGRCNICGNSVFIPTSDYSRFVHIGEMAHNVAHSNNLKAPRFIDNSAPDNTYNNLILLCANDHKIVDQDLNKYTVEKLREIKINFENSIVNRLDASNSSNDKYLVDLINGYCDFQYILNSIDDPLYVLPHNIGNIGDINNFILEKFTPSMYPFDDKLLNNYMKNILHAYYGLRNYIFEYYFTSDGINLRLSTKHSIQEKEKNNIIYFSGLLFKAIYKWILYCRSEYS